MLYQHDLYLVRKERPERLSAALLASGAVSGDDVGGTVALLGGVRALVEEGALRTPGGTALQVVALLIEDQDVGRLTSSFDSVVSWLAETVRAANLLVVFMPGGPDGAGDAPGVEPFLGALIDEGRVVTAHALMWWADSVARSPMCLVDSPPYRKVQMSGVGCLVALVDIAVDGSFEILEPGTDPVLPLLP